MAGTPFSALAELCRSLEATTKRKEKRICKQSINQCKSYNNKGKRREI